MSAIVDAVLQVDRSTWICVLLMAAVGAALVSANVGSWLISLCFFPGLLAGSLAFRILTQRHEIAVSSDKTIDNIIMASAGATLSLLVLMLSIRFLKALSDWTTPAPKRDPREVANLIGRRI